jgi:hypothetical protein
LSTWSTPGVPGVPLEYPWECALSTHEYDRPGRRLGQSECPHSALGALPGYPHSRLGRRQTQMERIERQADRRDRLARPFPIVRPIERQTGIYIYLYIYLFIYTYVCMCARACDLSRIAPSVSRSDCSEIGGVSAAYPGYVICSCGILRVPLECPSSTPRVPLEYLEYSSSTPRVPLEYS